MSARHTRSGPLANDLHNGTCLVPSMGWFQNPRPPGQHRVQRELPEWEKGLTCARVAKGFCPPSIDGYCLGGQANGRCHG